VRKRNEVGSPWSAGDRQCITETPITTDFRFGSEPDMRTGRPPRPVFGESEPADRAARMSENGYSRSAVMRR